MRDGAADVMLLFEMVGAVSLSWDGAAHETWEGEGRSVITWVPEPAVGSDRAQGLQPALPAVPVMLVVAAQDPASKWPVLCALHCPQTEPQENPASVLPAVKPG